MSNEQFTTYTVKARSTGNLWQFKYDLNGAFVSFQILDGILNQKQMQFLANIFPFYEDWIQQWQEKLKDNFEISVGEPDLSFDNAWALYDLKHAKQDAQKSFNKLNKADKLQFFKSIPHYKAHLLKSGVAQAHLATYINKRRFDDEYPIITPGKTENPLIKVLAELKTEK